MAVEKRKKQVGEAVAVGGMEQGAGIATEGATALQVGYENVERVGHETDKYDVTPLTMEQRKELGIEQYYRPFRVNKQAAVTSRGAYWLGKRVFDVICAGLALVVLSPLLGIVLLAIYIEDPKASPIFKQERVGMNGRIYKMLKLRWMEGLWPFHKGMRGSSGVVCGDGTKGEGELGSDRGKEGLRGLLRCLLYKYTVLKILFIQHIGIVPCS